MNVPMKPPDSGFAAGADHVRADHRARTACTMSRRVALATTPFAAVIVAAGVACAQSPNGAVKEFGLIGTWADNCNAQPGPSNQHATFSVTARGTVLLRNDFGPNYGDMIYRVVEATRLSHFRISLRQVLTTDSEVALDTVMLKANAKARIWSSHGIDGRQYVEDGLVPSADNRETGWMERCDMRSASRTAP